MNRIHYMLITLTILAFGTIFLYTYMVVDGTLFRKPITFSETTLETTKKVYHPGEEVDAVMSYCKNRDTEAMVQWTLIDTYLRVFPQKVSHVPVGCVFDKVVAIEVIPPDAYADTYHFDGYLTYKINLFSKVRVHIQTQDFKVIR